MLMDPRGAVHLDGDSLGEGEVLHPHAHSRSLRHRCLPNNAVVAVRPLYKEGGDSIRGDEGEVKCQQPALDLAPVYLHNTDRIFCCFIFYVSHLCTLMRSPDGLSLVECENLEGLELGMQGPLLID